MSGSPSGLPLYAPEIDALSAAPAGDRVAFIWNRTGRPELYVADALSGDRRQVTSEELRRMPFAGDFCWIDGERLLYIRFRGSGTLLGSRGPIDLVGVTIDGTRTTSETIDRPLIVQDAHPTRSTVLLSDTHGRLFELDYDTGERRRISSFEFVRDARYGVDARSIVVRATSDPRTGSDERTLYSSDIETGTVEEIDVGGEDGNLRLAGVDRERRRLLLHDPGSPTRFCIYRVDGPSTTWLGVDDDATRLLGFRSDDRTIVGVRDGTPVLVDPDTGTTEEWGIDLEIGTTYDALVATENAIVGTRTGESTVRLESASSLADSVETLVESSEGPGAEHRSMLAAAGAQLSRLAPPDEDRSPEGKLYEEERAALEDLLDEGFEVIGRGFARIILGFPSGSPLADHVVKLATPSHTLRGLGMLQNRWEDYQWERVDEGPLVPVVASDLPEFRWLVMPRGDPIDDRPADEQRAIAADLYDEIISIDGFHRSDAHRYNVVMYDGEPRIADYGLPPFL